MTVQVDVTTDDAKVQAALKELARKTSDVRPALREIGSSLEASTQQRFLDEVSPEGEDWQEHAESTQERRGAGAEKLQLDRHLFDDIGSKVSGATLNVGVNRIYGRIQHLGGFAGRGRKVEIPARPYLGVSADDEREIHSIFADHLRGGA